MREAIFIVHKIHRMVQILQINRVGQNPKNTPYMTVYLVVFLPKTPYIYRICMVLADSTDKAISQRCNC